MKKILFISKKVSSSFKKVLDTFLKELDTFAIILFTFLILLDKSDHYTISLILLNTRYLPLKVYKSNFAIYNLKQYGRLAQRFTV